MKLSSSYLYFTLIVLILFSCKPNNPSWESGYLVPLVKTSLTFSDIVNDSLLQEQTDNSISLVYRQDIQNVNFDSLVKVPAASFDKTAKLANLSLPNANFKANITLGMIAQSIAGWGPVIISQNGSNVVLPDILNTASGPHPNNIQDIFLEATFLSGFMDISLRNDFPADVANLDYRIENFNSGSTFITHSFPYVATGTTESVSLDLSGKTLEGNINAYLLNLDFLVNNQSVFIDTSKALDITITLRDLVIQTATAIFPDQEVINEKVEVNLSLNDTKLKQVNLGEGEIIIDVVSTVQDTIYFDYAIPGAVKNGISFTSSAIIPPAPIGSNVVTSYSHDFADYELDLRGISGTSSNLLYSELIGRIDSTGEMVTLSENDSLKISLRVENFKPSYVKGFLGLFDYDIGPESIDFDVFKNVVSGGVSLENVSTYFTIENSVGVIGGLNIKKLTAFNSNSSATIDLISGDLANPLVIDKAMDSPLTPSITNFLLDNQNSNITDLIGIMPNKLSYEFGLSVNKDIDSTSTDFQDFAYLNSSINSAIDLEMPLSLIANDLTLRDTIELELETLLKFENVESVNLNFIVDNGFPLSTDFKLYFLSDDNTVQVSLLSDEIVEAAPLTNGRVLESLRSVLIFPITSEEIDNISNSTKLLLVASFNSDDASFIKIYSDYSLRTTLAGDFKYKH